VIGCLRDALDHLVYELTVAYSATSWTIHALAMAMLPFHIPGAVLLDRRSLPEGWPSSHRLSLHLSDAEGCRSG
jgi:hypothetical protein